MEINFSFLEGSIKRLLQLVQENIFITRSEFSSTQGQKYTQPRGFFIFYYTTCIYSFVFSGSLCVYMLLFQFLNHCMAFFGFSYYLNFQALKVLRTADYAPYVVFIAAPRFNDHLLRKTKDMNVSQDIQARTRVEIILQRYSSYNNQLIKSYIFHKCFQDERFCDLYCDNLHVSLYGFWHTYTF